MSNPNGPNTPLYAVGVALTATGTAQAVRTGGGFVDGSVVGVGTLFTTEFAVGDIIIIGGAARTVEQINSNTAMVTYPDWPATTSTGLAITGYNCHTTLVQRGILAPKGTFTEYSQPIELGDGTVRGGGWATAEWQWGFMPRDQRDALRVLIPGASAALYMVTASLDGSDKFETYHGVAVWPAGEARSAGRLIGLTIKWRALTLMTVF